MSSTCPMPVKVLKNEGRELRMRRFALIQARDKHDNTARDGPRPGACTSPGRRVAGDARHHGSAPGGVRPGRGPQRDVPVESRTLESGSKVLLPPVET